MHQETLLLAAGLLKTHKSASTGLRNGEKCTWGLDKRRRINKIRPIFSIL